MNQHYSGHDPATGCGLMILSALIVATGIVLALVLIAGGVHL